jgi:hypothetical protein
MPESYNGPVPVLDPDPDILDFKQLFTTGPGHGVWALIERNGVWGEWEPLGEQTDALPCVDRYRTSPTTVFVRNSADNVIRFKRRVSGIWSEWTSLGMPPGVVVPSSFVVGHATDDQSDHVEVYVVSRAGLWRCVEGTAFGAWEALALPPGIPATTSGRLAVQTALFPSGRLGLFLLDDRGAVWMKRPDESSWTAILTGTGGVPADPVRALRTFTHWGNDRALLVFATTEGGILKYKVSSTGDELSDWRQTNQTPLPNRRILGLPAFIAGTLCAISDGSVWVTHTDNSREPGFWSPWTSLGAPPDANAGNWLNGLALALDTRSETLSDVGVQLFAGARQYGIWTRKQDGRNGPWGPWARLADTPYAVPPPPPPRPRPKPSKPKLLPPPARVKDEAPKQQANGSRGTAASPRKNPSTTAKRKRKAKAK